MTTTLHSMHFQRIRVRLAQPLPLVFGDEREELAAKEVILPDDGRWIGVRVDEERTFHWLPIWLVASVTTTEET